MISNENSGSIFFNFSSKLIQQVLVLKFLMALSAKKMLRNDNLVGRKVAIKASMLCKNEHFAFFR